MVDGNDAEHEARSVQRAITRVLEIRTAAGQVVLAGLWRMYNEQLYLALGYDRFEDWARSELGGYDVGQYHRELALIVVRILAPIEISARAGQPYTDVKGEPITAERLVETPGLLGKMKIVSDAVSAAIDAGKGEEVGLIRAIVSGTRRDVENARNAITRKGTVLNLPGMQQLNSDGTTDIYFPRLTGPQVAMLQAMLGEAAALEFESVAPCTNLSYTDVQPEKAMSNYREATRSLARLIGRAPDMQWTMADTAAHAPGVANDLRAKTVGVLENELGLTREQRLKFCGQLFDRTLKSGDELRRNEVEALSRMLRIPAFRQLIKENPHAPEPV